MARKQLKLLWDIQQAIAGVDEHLQGNNDLNVYLQNKTMRRAVERELEIIGEAMNKLLKLNPEVPITNSINIIGQRNQLIHAYDGIDDEQVWDVVVNHLPLLKMEVEKLLNQ